MGVEPTNPVLAGTLVLKTRRATGPIPPPILRWERSLRWMPTEGPPAQQVQVQMKHCLPAIAVTIDHQAEAPIRNPYLSCDPVRHQQEVAEQSIISLIRIEECREVLARNNQDMDGRLRVDVFEGDRLLVLKHNFARTFSVSDLAKEAGIHVFALSILRLVLFPIAVAQFPSHF